MLKKAVEEHGNTAAPSRNTLKQQLFPSSSPHEPAPSRDALRPSASSVLNNNVNARPAPANVSVKRTANGLAKALGGGIGNAFQDGSISQTSYSSSAWDAAPALQKENVVFDEDDFDSDVDLDVEELAPKPTVSYPAITRPPPPPSNPITYPSLQRATFHSQASAAATASPSQSFEPPPNSSQAHIPWSSSPSEHFRVPTKSFSLNDYAYDKDIDSRLPAKNTSVEPALERPAKRRTLPWLKEVSAAEEAHDDIQEISSHTIQTPQGKSNGVTYPWNTTGSAIKEQQKQLRKDNRESKRAVKASKHTPETNAEFFNTKKRQVTLPTFGLSKEQRFVLDLVTEQKKNVFFTGAAGTGKSVLLREIVSALKRQYHKEPDRVAITASTGLAACNIGGSTLHSFAGIGLGQEDAEHLVKNIKRNSKSKQRWLRTKVLIIDEISMVEGQLLDKLEQVARRMKNNSRPFGGIQLIITGDFFQLPPVGGGAKFAFESQTWKDCIDHTIGLHHVFRQKDSTFANMLNEMREGRLSQKAVETFKSLARPLDSRDELSATELYPTRDEARIANETRLNQLKGIVKIYSAQDSGTMAPERREKLLDKVLAPDELKLKKGAQVMLIKNIDEMLVNGSLGKVQGFMNEAQFDSYNADPDEFETLADADPANLNPAQQRKKAGMMAALRTGEVWPLIRFTVSDGTTRDLLCNRETWKTELPSGEIVAQRKQVPLILAWALSIHKAQGQTLERVKIDLGKTFERGQAYVAMSRATSMAGLQVLRFDPKKVIAHDRVRTFYASLSRAEAEEEKQKNQGGKEDSWEMP